ncbi:MAG: TonB-dependent receptor [Gammaproteobacteria bacterium]|nr:TonB-dependent receptor [Gammaproteobacteria bacterium]
MNTRNHSHGLVLGAVSAVLAWSAQAQQAAAPAKGAGLEEIVVTATKRETSLHDVPFSVAAVTADQVRASGAGNVVELARNVAGLTITDLGPGQSQVAIRGVSAGQVIRDQPGVKPQVGVYLDETPISVALFTPDLDLFDLDRFEVLRGPQGTLFGSGSIAGTLRYITAQPKIGVHEGLVEVGASTVNNGGTGGDIKGAVNLPTSATTALRLVGYHDELPGFITAYGPNGGVEKGANSGKKDGARVAFTWKPNEVLSITPRLVYQKLTTDGYPRIDIYNILGNPYTTTEPAINLGNRGQYRQFREGIDDDFRLGDLKLVVDAGVATLTSITSYTDRKITVLRDASQLTGSVTYQFGGTSADVRTNSPLYDRHHLKALSQELRLASNGKDALQWLGGIYFEHLKRDYGQDLPTPGYDAIVTRLLGPGPGLTSAENGAPPDTPFFSDLHYNFTQYAAFGEMTYKFANRTALTAGARWFRFDEDRTLYFGGLFSAPTGPTPIPGSTSSNGLAPRAILSFEPSDDIKINVEASRGFRLGGINDPLNAPLCQPADLASYGGHPDWKDEWAWNYEVGAKMRFDDRRVSFNVAAFYSDIKDLQVPADAGSCSSRVVFNVPKARSQGIEAELYARPNTNWDFGISATYADATLQSSVLDSAGQPIAGMVSGARMPTAPKLQAVASVGFTLPTAFANKWDFYSNVVGQYVGDSYTQIGDEVAGFGTVSGGAFFHFGNPTVNGFTFNPKLPAYQIVNLRAGVRANGWDVAAYVNNVTDEIAYLSVDRERGRRARVGFLTNQPRTFGVSIQKKF